MSFIIGPLGPGAPEQYRVEPVAPSLLPAQPREVRMFNKVGKTTPPAWVNQWFPAQVRVPTIVRPTTLAGASTADLCDQINLRYSPDPPPSNFMDGYDDHAGRAILANPGLWWIAPLATSASVDPFAGVDLLFEFIDVSNPAVLWHELHRTRAFTPITLPAFTLTVADTLVFSANQYMERGAVMITNTGASTIVGGIGCTTATPSFAIPRAAPPFVLEGRELPLSSLHLAMATGGTTASALVTIFL